MSRISKLLTAAFLSSLALGWAMAPSNPEVQVVMAACSTAPNCTMDPTTTAALVVDHQTTGGDPVLPDDGETWTVTATWSSDTTPIGCSCVDLFFDTVGATVTYSSSTGWAVNCTGCAAGEIEALDICEVGQGCDNAAGALGYKLIASVDHSRVFGGLGQCLNVPTYLQKVSFTSTSVDDGDIISDYDCSAGSAVSPTSQVWTATDTGAFECAFNCAASTGASVTILYQ